MKKIILYTSLILNSFWFMYAMENKNYTNEDVSTLISWLQNKKTKLTALNKKQNSSQSHEKIVEQYEKKTELIRQCIKLQNYIDKKNSSLKKQFPT